MPPRDFGWRSKVLDELANVLHRKLRRTWPEIAAAIDDLCGFLQPLAPLTIATHRSAPRLARDHGFAFDDALIVAAAIACGCDMLLSEDMQDGCAVAGLGIVNPFR